MANEGFHEAIEDLSDDTLRHRAIRSLLEPLKAVDCYNQRVDGCQEDALRVFLARKCDEEKEHKAMLLKWSRRRDAKLDDERKDYLFTDKPIAHE